ncbi:MULTISPECIES: TolB family protein [Nitrospirillum]|uniref:WD40 repeat protein n=1 Tax=Nitrospirillum amazonense TaxID=28077 RepID=A0A560FUW1_9PROT|nr:PD40 domain-containing protein [Nitrospirillum amazonense]MEC4593678.1 PD40 domain-containing protein [Nitrospirillum amazonense]TWB25425.1 WD40 repeat protein [Nitrospirillum amazonense]
MRFAGFATFVAAMATAVIAHADDNDHFRSRITLFDVASGKTTVLFTDDTVWEAPNWAPDGQSLLANSQGVLYRIPVAGPDAGHPKAIPMGDLRCNNDKAYTRIGDKIAASCGVGSMRDSFVYVVGKDGVARTEDARRMTPATPSYFHGWSPDGQWLSFVAKRNGAQTYNLYRVPVDGPVDGSAEQRLTNIAASDDGPDYSPDGRWIYINSDRQGGWDIWRLPADGAGPNESRAQRVTHDALEDWFPHPSPDGRKLLMLSFPAGTKTHDGRIPGVQLRLMDLPGDGTPKADAPIRSLLTFFGGQGSLNVNSWSPDSQRFAFVSYEPLP